MDTLASALRHMTSPDFPNRLSRLRAAIQRSGHDGLGEEDAAEILGLPLPVFRLIAAYRQAELIEQKAEFISGGVMVCKPHDLKGLLRVRA